MGVMKKILITVLIYIFSLTSSYASGFGWYVSSFDWGNFSEQLEILDGEKIKEKKDEMANLIIDEITARRTLQERKKSFSFYSVPESPMTSIEFYWPDALSYANETLIKKGKTNNYFTHFSTGKSSIDLPKGTINNYYDPAFFILSPKDVSKFYSQLAKLSENTSHPDQYKPYLLHLEGVLLKNSVGNERGLVFFGND